ncbi:transcriptional repressor [Alteraurantiacibacter aquimixticola]|uniref:Transcriptional repressor n=2 Tax=Alteraurantiacibacter aquimixticola TaxID=2489173 RepID=A0A4T3F3D9_9SPHN|nr:transcriptional repressor [Alteraurantiacibacter aquimixticola]
MSAYDLVEHLASQGEKVAPQQVYRSLGRLCSEGAVRRIESLHAYCAGGEDGGAILYCERCGALRFPSVAHLADALREHAQGAGFSTSRAVIELCGLCEQCSSAPSAWEEYQ